MKFPLPTLDLPDHLSYRMDDEVKTQVLGIMAALYPRNDLLERRREVRYPFPCLIHLTPVGLDGHSPCGDTIVVVGRDISEHGLGFYHQMPLPYRRMIASFEVGRDRWFGFLIDLSWCRFTKDGWYESGGRFLETAISPLESHPAD